MCHRAAKRQIHWRNMVQGGRGKHVLRPGVCGVQLRPHLCLLPLSPYFSVKSPGQVAMFVYRDLLQGQIMIFILHMAFCAFEVICRRPGDPWITKIPWRREWLPHSRILAWILPWTEEPNGLQSTGLQSQTWLNDQPLPMATFTSELSNCNGNIWSPNPTIYTI